MNKIVRSIVLGFVAFAIVALVSTAGRPAGPEFFGAWSAGQNLTHHRAPGAGQLMNTSPIALLLVYPLGFLGMRAAMLVWMTAGVACLALSLHGLGTARQHRVLAYCFAPVFACLAGGTLAPFILLGISLFVACYRRRPLLAGASLLFVAVEPHLMYVLAPVVLLDLVCRRNWRVALGAAAALVVGGGIATWLEPNLWQECGSRLLHASRQAGIEWVPSALAAVWALCFYWSKRGKWDWTVDLAPLLFVTVLAAPFASAADQVLLLPAVLATVGSSNRARYAATWFVAINAVALTLVIAQVDAGRVFYLGTSAAWFAWFLYSRGGKVKLEARSYGAAMARA